MIRSLIPLLLAPLWACRATPEPPPAPGPLLLEGARVDLSLFHGTPLSGPTEDPGQDPSEEGQGEDEMLWQVHVQLVYLEYFPEKLGQPLTAEAQLAMSLSGTKPVLPASVLFDRAVRVTKFDPMTREHPEFNVLFGRSHLMGEARVHLMRDTSLRLEVTSTEAIHDPDDWLGVREDAGPFRKGVTIEFGRTGEDAPQLILQLTNVPRNAWATLSEASDFQLSALETAAERLYVHAPPVAEEGPWVALLPAPFQAGPGRGIGLRVTVSEVPATEELVRIAWEDLERKRIQAPDVVDEAQLEFAAARAAFSKDGTRAAGLLWLSDRSGAPLTADVALVADQQLLIDLEEALRVHLQDPDPATIGWQVEGTTLRFLAARLNSQELDPSLASILIRHLGEVGRLPGLMLDVVAASSSRQALVSLLLQENGLLLHDSSPASRSRAYQWLKAQAAAPTGFDPLADRDTRRAALERDAAERQGSDS